MRWMFLPLRRYVQFSGRAQRMEFWMYMLLLALIQVVFFVLIFIIALSVAAMAGRDGTGAANGFFGMFASIGILVLFYILIQFGLFLPTLAVQVRRLHDSDRSGWWVMLFFGPWLVSWLLGVLGAVANEPSLSIASIIAMLGYWAGTIVLIVFYCMPGTRGTNRFGPDPLGSTVDLAQTFQ